MTDQFIEIARAALEEHGIFPVEPTDHWVTNGHAAVKVGGDVAAAWSVAKARKHMDVDASVRRYLDQPRAAARLVYAEPPVASAGCVTCGGKGEIPAAKCETCDGDGEHECDCGDTHDCGDCPEPTACSACRGAGKTPDHSGAVYQAGEQLVAVSSLYAPLLDGLRVELYGGTTDPIVGLDGEEAIVVVMPIADSSLLAAAQEHLKVKQ